MGAERTPITTHLQMAELPAGTSIRFITDKGPGLALRNEDGTWSATGMGDAVETELLFSAVRDVSVLLAPGARRTAA